MTELRAYVVLLTIGLTVQTVLWVGLHAMGVREEGLVEMSLAVLVVFGFLSGFVPDYFPRDRHRR